MSHLSGPGRQLPETTTAGPGSALRIGLIGVNGYGRTHLQGTAVLAEQGRAEPAAYADVAPNAPEVIAEAFEQPIPGYRSYQEMLAKERLDIVVISTPIHLHAEMIARAFSHGVSVLVEKPPVVTIQELRNLLALQDRKADETGVRPHCQVGFQSVGSPAVSALGQAIRSGALGEIGLIGAAACWRRADSYYARAEWAGRLVDQGRLVLDGTLTNPLAHSLMNCLLVAGEDEARPAVPRSVRAELFRCRPDIDGDDTSSVRITTENGHTIVLATTLCAAEQSEPYLFAKGSKGTATAFYTSGRFHTDPPDLVPPVEAPVERFGLLAELVAVVSGEATDLRCPLERTESYVRALNGMYESAGRPRLVPPDQVEVSHADGDRFVHLRQVEQAIQTCADQGLTFSEAGVGWADPSAEYDLAGYDHFGLLDRFTTGRS